MIWTEESAALLSRAYRHGSAVRELADWIASGLRPGAHVCDAGCGVGALSLELARRGFCVTALDISAVALNQLRADMGGEQIRVLCEDVGLHTPETPYDAMVFSFFGSMEECMAAAKRCCAGSVFHVSRNYDMHRFSVGRHPLRRSGYSQAKAYLDAAGIPCQAQECALDMGQPFADTEEARRFFALYSRDDPALITDEFLENRLIQTPEAAYPLYMPHMRRAGMVHFCMKDIPQEDKGTR